VIFVGVDGGLVPNRNVDSDIGGHGTARNGLVRISLSASGLVETVEMDPRVRRSGHSAFVGMKGELLLAQHGLEKMADTAEEAENKTVENVFQVFQKAKPYLDLAP
jgi:DNA-binding protein YbaB